MTSGKVQLSEHAAIEFCRNLVGKIRKFFGIVSIWTTGGELPEDGVFSNSGDRRHANKTASLKGVLQLSQSVIPLPIAVNAVKNSLRPIGCNLFETLNGDLRYSSGK